MIIHFGGGTLGGKGEGLAAIDALLGQPCALAEKVPGLAIALPRTAIIGVEVFEEFAKDLPLREFSSGEVDYALVRARFLATPLPASLVAMLAEFLPDRGQPVIARSSSLLEDSSGEPCSGVYESYAIPNDHPEDSVRLGQLCDAIRLVYSSLFSPDARAYCAGAPDEMAVVLQDLIGSRRGRWFYPILSGSAQSYNFYPLSHAQPEDGLCIAALGLGSYVVEGGVSYRFCPRYPTVNAAAPELTQTQTSFRALDMELPAPDLSRGESAALADLDIGEAEGTDALSLVASTWDRDDARLVPGTARQGARIIDFGPLLKYDALPFAEAIAAALEAGERSCDGPVEMEFALDGNRETGAPTLYLLQLKRLLRKGGGAGVELGDEIVESKDDGRFVYSEKSIGDGKIEGVCDIVWVDPQRFDRAKSHDAALEIASLDRELDAQGRPYVLIGPGRWGSRDPWLGVPVTYPQIARAAVIIETELPGFSVDFSFGSHFMRNIEGRGIGYLTVASRGAGSIDWDWLDSLPRKGGYAYCSRASLEEPLEILMDGRRGRALIRKRSSCK